MKYLLLVYVVCISTMSCNQTANNTTVPIKTDSTNIIVAKQLFEKFNSHDWAGMATLYTDTAEFKDPSLGIGIVKQSRIETVKKYTELHKIFADIKDSIVATYPINNTSVVVEFVSKGTAPDGSKFELPICSILTINDKGLIQKDYTYYDNSGNK